VTSGLHKYQQLSFTSTNLQLQTTQQRTQTLLAEDTTRVMTSDTSTQGHVALCWDSDNQEVYSCQYDFSRTLKVMWDQEVWYRT